jgi:predicted nucleic acid-binding protein
VILATHASYVLDASVVAKWFTRHEEPDREKAVALRDLHCRGRCRLVLPEFGLLEVLNAIRFSRRAQEPDVTAALTVLKDLGLEIRPMDWDVLRKTVAISWSYGVTLYDAAYVALAERLGYPLITADDALRRRMKGHSIVIPLALLEAMGDGETVPDPGP